MAGHRCVTMMNSRSDGKTLVRTCLLQLQQVSCRSEKPPSAPVATLELQLIVPGVAPSTRECFDAGDGVCIAAIMSSLSDQCGFGALSRSHYQVSDLRASFRLATKLLSFRGETQGAL
ncbi:unnamed protein product [Caenorhabditis auriculariae]|uniref:Uncharacterized protein n=1 Tax=Caenorhabditis auriculariae TaxID=2777116 RepID=A0A8S1GZE1_9PELO|nr:unnamed protein product [Caenorhabditis auriculariae]